MKESRPNSSWKKLEYRLLVMPWTWVVLVSHRQQMRWESIGGYATIQAAYITDE